MPGRILIVDTVATNRIVLKVKMIAAQFQVDACGSRIEAEAIISTNRPDLILINLSDPVEDRHAFCKTLKSERETANIAVIAVGVADTARARLAALDAGADDVLPNPMNDVLLMARIRSLLRVSSAWEDLLMRDTTSRALGFEEAPAQFQPPAKVALLTPDDTDASGLLDMLRYGLALPVKQIRTPEVLKNNSTRPAPDLFVIDGTRQHGDDRQLFGLVSDLRSRAATRQSGLLVITPDASPDIAAMFLDLGADDAVPECLATAEITLRAKALIRRKRTHDHLRTTVRNGLQAALTDPLTGLYNRRYVDPHLGRLVEQSRLSGQALAIMMLDIDHFKSINDRFGHPAGDSVLVQLADRLRENLRAIDLVARVGGEEFLIAMPRTSAAQAHAAADRLRRIVNRAPFDVGKAHPPLNVTVSVGVAVRPHSELTEKAAKQMCDEADTALYAAKSAGRDQVAISRAASRSAA
ncbi:diguanylate cyclase [Yoonia sp. SS1-5]|uniref:diguanylate cyclase n=1 Tax=Yoonia rhodophyticola TaxID=3137370 RepID=A0AAN0M921_9RHOB